MPKLIVLRARMEDESLPLAVVALARETTDPKNRTDGQKIEARRNAVIDLARSGYRVIAPVNFHEESTNEGLMDVVANNRVSLVLFDTGKFNSIKEIRTALEQSGNGTARIADFRFWRPDSVKKAISADDPVEALIDYRDRPEQIAEVLRAMGERASVIAMSPYCLSIARAGYVKQPEKKVQHSKAFRPKMVFFLPHEEHSVAIFMEDEGKRTRLAEDFNQIGYRSEGLLDADSVVAVVIQPSELSQDKHVHDSVMAYLEQHPETRVVLIDDWDADSLHKAMDEYQPDAIFTLGEDEVQTVTWNTQDVCTGETARYLSRSTRRSMGGWGIDISVEFSTR